MMFDTDVIIVGAGAAGLSAARELARAGLSYRLVEAADRVGGRAYSTEIAPGEWFDHGCAWLVGGETNPFTQIAAALGVQLSTATRHLFTLEHMRLVRNGRPVDAAERDARVSYFEACERAISTAAEQGRDVALSEVLELDEALAQPFRTMIDTSWGGASFDQVSSTDHASCEGDLGYRVVQGYGSLVAAWGADVPVFLEAPVERIDWSGNPVRVETPKGTITGRAVLVTVSTGVLGAGSIGFHPRLPDWKQAAVHDLPMGTENKIGVHFDKDVFGDEGRAYYTAWTDAGAAARVDAGVMGFDTAVVLVGGSQAIPLEEEGPRAMKNFAIDRLAEIFGRGIRKHVDRCVTTAWKRYPFTLGSWAGARPGQTHQRETLARPVDDRLFFAGEATLIGPQGTCHGAYQSGLRAAREIAGVLKGINLEVGVQ